MPELPEVEIIARGLTKKIKGLVIKDIEVLSPKSFQGDEKQIVGKKVKNIWRKAKMLGIELEGEMTLLVHLKMSGQIVFVPNTGKKSTPDQSLIGGHPTPDMFNQMPIKATRIIFAFEDGSHLYFNDQRKFGWIKALDPAALLDLEAKLFQKLGPEPLEKEFTWQVLKQQLSKHPNFLVKVALLDQNTISGIGNIYACEALFLAKIHPKVKVRDLTDDQYKKLQLAIVKALTLSIEYGGSSKTNYVNADGGKGYFLTVANVYGREKEPCRVCGTLIEKIRLAGRGTTFCPHCQKEPSSA